MTARFSIRDRIKRLLARLGAGLLVIGVALLAVEIILFAVRGFALPTLPYHTDALGVAYLPADRRMRVNPGDSATTLYVTDRFGGRITANANANGDGGIDGGIHVLGDSQPLGYGMDFESTFAGRLGAQLEPGTPVRILGAPTMDLETLLLRACAETGALSGTPRLQVITFNLGNDLDEMYVAGRSRRTLETGSLQRWLVARSQLYASWIIWQSRRALARHTVPGINPILFQLDSAERVVLAREAVKRISEILDCSRADEQIVLVLPSDFQVDPGELEKYRPYSAEPELFQEWYDQRAALAEMMNSIEDYILRRLETDGVRVYSFRREAIARDMPAEVLFDRHSHHLTVQGHALVAEILGQSR